VFIPGKHSSVSQKTSHCFGQHNLFTILWFQFTEGSQQTGEAERANEFLKIYLQENKK